MTSKFALVIANTEYQDASLAKLTAPGEDAEEFARVLREPGLAAFDDVQVLLNEGEGRIRRSIARFFVDRKPDELLLLYFSGHGVRNEQGQLYLAVSDTERNILEATGIPAEFITHAMNNSRSQRQLLVLDCCNSGAFAYGGKAASALGNSMGIAAAFEGSGYGRVVLTASDATQYAWEGDKVIGSTQNSVFTHFLIEGLKGDADRDGDGRITVDELYDYAYEQVVRRTPKQTPGKWSYKQQGDIILRDNLKIRDVKPASLPPDLLDLLSHPNSSVRRVGIQDLINLLDGKHLGLARAAQNKLHEIAATDDSLTLRKTASDTLITHGLVMEEPAPVETPKTMEPPVGRDVIPPREIPSPRVSPLSQGERVEMRKESLPRVLTERKITVPKNSLRIIGGIVGALLIITLCIWGGSSLLNNLFVSAGPTRTAQPTKTRTPPPTQVSITLSPTSVPITPTLGIGSTMTSPEDGMTLLYVPAGKFTMGSDTDTDYEKPVHTVSLDAFWIDQTEVTNAMYAKCVLDGECKLPSSTKSSTRDRYYGNFEFDDYPVIYVSWNDAKAYCGWAGRRLPTEAEWEKAASWDEKTKEKYVYPWGNAAPNTNLLNYNSVGDTTEVGKFSNGASPYGALDMAGNVWEWVSSLYKPYPYNATDGREDLSSTDIRVLRGGSWLIVADVVRSAYRLWDDPSLAISNLGFRCSRSQ